METNRHSDSSGRPSAGLAWRDSRAAALAILTARRGRVLVKVLSFLVVFAVALLAWNTLTGELPPDQRSVLLLLMLAIGLWATEAVPAFAVGLLIIGYLVFVLGTPLLLDEPRDVSAYVNTWSSQVIWLLLGGFVLADGMSRTGLDRDLLARAIRPAGTRPDRVLLAIMLTSAVGSMFISNTSTTVLLVGAVLPLVRRLGRREPFGRSLLVAIPLAASVGGMGTIIGSAPNAIAAGVAADFGRNVDFIEWMLLGVPVSLLLVVVAWVFLRRRYPAGISSVSLDLDDASDVEPPSLRDRGIVGGVALVTVALWMTTPLHGIHTAAISLIPIVVLTMTQVIDATRIRGLPWDTLMLVAGGLSLGAAVVDTGLAERLASGLSFLTGLDTALPVFVSLALLTVVVSNFMSNTATVSLVLPIAVALLPGRELETCLILGLSASCALLLPVSTPPNAVVHATGELETRDFRAGGLLIGLLGPLAIILWVLLVSRLVT
jgi:sodium-dependent dicarboxylate transporter 2/3/5